MMQVNQQNPSDSSAAGVLPSNTDYIGPYGFEIGFDPQTRQTKSTSWTYSEQLRKLYVRLATPCPIKYRAGAAATGALMPSGLVLRCTPIFMKPEHLLEIVKRCPYHATIGAAPAPATAPGEDRLQGIESATSSQHFVRCEHSLTQYCEEAQTGRQSVIVPFEAPAVGADWSTALYQFMCFSSCAGGLNRRQVLLVFTIEMPVTQSPSPSDPNSWRVIGRRVIEIRVCACPGRDRRAEERALTGSVADDDELAGTPSKTFDAPLDSPAGAGAADPFPFPPAATATRTLAGDARRKLDGAGSGSGRTPVAKRRRADSNADEDDELEYSVPVTGRRNFLLLMKIRDSLEVARQLERSGQRLSTLLHPQHSSGESSASASASAGAGVAGTGLRCEERAESDGQRSSPGSSTPLQSSGGLSTLLGCSVLPNPHSHSQESVVKQELLIEMPSSFVPQPIHAFQQALAQPYLQQVQLQPSNMALNYQFVQRPTFPAAISNSSAVGAETRGYAMVMSAEGGAPAGAYLQGNWASAGPQQAMHSTDRLPFEGCSVAVPMSYAQHTAATSWIPTASSNSAAAPTGGYDAVDSGASTTPKCSNSKSIAIANDSELPERHQTPAPASDPQTQSHAVDSPRKTTRRTAQKQTRHDEVVPSILPGQQTRAIVIEISHETISETPATKLPDTIPPSITPAGSLRAPGSCASDSDKENA